jgi:hypothetical protein
MGLHHTAHYLRSKGRGNDTMLVHMTPSEVKGLQAIALRHGGSLTINPDTGLPEAGFLEQILPIVAAAGLTYLTAGAAAPTLTAALGGSSLAGGIAAGALSGAAISGGMAAIQGKDAGQAALMGGLGGGVAGGLGAYADAPNLLSEMSQKTAETAGTEAGKEFTKQSLEASANATLNPATGNIAPPASTNAAGYNISTPNPSAPGTFINPEIGPIGGTLAPTDVVNPYATQAGINAAALPEGAARNAALEALAKDTGALAEGSANLTGKGLAAAPQPTFYSDLGSYGKIGVQSLPVLGLLEDEQQGAGPTDTYQSPLRRISPDFRAYEPPRPNPYYSAQYPRYAAEGGIMQSYQAGGPVERMSQMNTAMNPQGGLYPMGMIDKTQYATPTQRPVSAEMIEAAPAYERSNPMLMNTGGAARLPKGDPGLYRDDNPTTRGQDSFTAALTRLNERQKKANIKGLPELKAAMQPLGNVESAARGGVMSSLGGYSDGGRMLKGPGDGMSDSIPASIANKQPARLADGEFVVPADVVSHLGNGSTDAGARKLYSMMDKIRKARTGKKKQAPAVKADRYMPA